VGLVIPRIFVGRQQELDELALALRSAASGQPRVALVNGAARTGKSALIAEFLRRHPGLPAIAVAAAEAETALPYAVVHQLAAAASAWGAAAGLPRGTAALLADLQPERLPADADPLAVGAGLRALFAALCDRCPAVVVAEDMQWADQPSATALLFACRRLATERLLVLLSATSAGQRLPAAWTRFIEGDRRACAIWLDGLDVSLTAQELRVARLVAVGMSNREAAARLFVSPKTVEYHLGNAYAKLGVRTRHQLATLIRAASN
jgi:DNA-binding CsgD family transcriptional regulator